MRLVSRSRFQYGAFALEPPVLATCYTPLEVATLMSVCELLNQYWSDDSHATCF